MAFKKYKRKAKVALVTLWENLQEEGLSAEAAAKKVGVARGTLKSWANPPKKKAAKKVGRP